MLTMSIYSIVYGNGGCVNVSLHCSFVCLSAGELAHWFSSNQALSHPRYELEQLSELQQVLHSRENELARKEDLLARKEEELVAMVTQLEEQSGRTQRLEHERSSEERRRRKLEQAERDLVSGRGVSGAQTWHDKKCYCRRFHNKHYLAFLAAQQQLDSMAIPYDLQYAPLIAHDMSVCVFVYVHT